MSQLTSNIRSILSSIMSYNRSEKRKKVVNITDKKIRHREHLLNIKNHYNADRYLRRLYHYSKRRFLLKKRKPKFSNKDRCKYLNKKYDDYNEAFNVVSLDNLLTEGEDLLEYTILAGLFDKLSDNDCIRLLTPKDFYYYYSLDKIITSFVFRNGFDRYQPFNLELD